MDGFIRKSALWVKEQAHAVRIVGGVFLGVALLFGVVWAFGVDVEPVAFTLSLLASIFFSLPSVAEYFVPDRKPIRHMSYDDLLKLLDQEMPSAWKVIHTDWAAEAFLIEDPRLRFRARHDDFGVHCEEFKESWATDHPDSRARSYWYDYIYDGNLIDRFIMVDVDGHRATLPLPDANSKNVQVRRYRVAQIFDRDGELDEYMQRSGLRVKCAEVDALLDRDENVGDHRAGQSSMS